MFLTDKNNQFVGLYLMAVAYGCKCSVYREQLMQCSGSEPNKAERCNVLMLSDDNLADCSACHIQL